MFILKTNRDWRTNQISQSVKLASQRRNRDRSGKDNKNSYFWKTKTKLVVRTIAIKEECYVLKKKKMHRSEKSVTPMGFAKYLRKLDVSENSKVYYGRFLRNGLHERYCDISKSRWDAQYLKGW